MRWIGLAVVLAVSLVLAPIAGEAQPTTTAGIGVLSSGSAEPSPLTHLSSEQ